MNILKKKNDEIKEWESERQRGREKDKAFNTERKNKIGKMKECSYL